MPYISYRSVVTPFSGTLPISLVEAKGFVNDTTEANDDIITRMIGSGFAKAEECLDRAILTQTRKWSFLGRPEPPVYLEPFDAESLVIRRAEDGSWESLESTDFTAIGEQGVVFANKTEFPDTKGDPVGALLYEFEAECGWAPDSLPEDLRSAILVYIKDLYDHRGIRDIGRPETHPWDPVMHYSWSMG